jgi:hypothetical protein
MKREKNKSAYMVSAFVYILEFGYGLGKKINNWF